MRQSEGWRSTAANGNAEPGLFLHGEPCAGSVSLPLVDPSTGQSNGILCAGGPEEAEEAAAAAASAHRDGRWRDLPPLSRQHILAGAAARIRAEAASLALGISAESGMPVGAARYIEVPMAADALDFFASAAMDPRGEVLPFFAPGGPPSQWAFTVREPGGVAALITPWNFPLLIPAWRVGAALAAGCTAVLKPAPETPRTALALARILTEAGLPADVLSVLCGGDQTGAALAAQPQVQHISLTGETSTGRTVMAAAASGLKRVSLELGGKSPVIVCSDADIDAAVSGALFGIFFHAGQVCQAGSRILVAEAIYAEFRQRFVERAAALEVGHATAAGTDVGPLCSQRQLQRVRAAVAAAVAAGAVRILEGAVPASGGGFFAPVTVFDRVDPKLPLAQQEIFGPVACLIPFETDQQAVELANGTSYGLAAGIWTRDVGRALRLAQAVQAGTVWVNTSLVLSPTTPFGGTKQSGVGRELGRVGIATYQETKSIIVETGEDPPHYF